MRPYHQARLILVTIIGVCCLCFDSRVFSADLYFGVPLSGARGNAFAREPFALEELNVMSCRYQQIYNASAFAILGNGGGWIREISFHSDELFGRGFAVTLPSVEILFGISQRSADGLSTTFADNFSGSQTAVSPRGELFIGAAEAGGFIDIPLPTPFFYNPADGNLLIEIRNYQSVPPPHAVGLRAGPMDAWNVQGDTVSRLFSYNVNATTGIADTLGLSTEFVVTPVPEPSTWGLLVLGAVMLGLWHRRRNQFNR